MKRFLRLLLPAALVAAPIAHAQRGPASVFVEPVEVQQFSQQIEALGTLEPNEYVELTLNAADRVRAIYFDDGQRVRKGKTLLSLAQDEQIAQVEGAEATVEEAQRQFERVTRLAEQQAVSQSELDQARRNLDSASASLRAVQSRQKDRVLVAPFDGVLGFRMVSVGSYVRAGDVVATLIDDSQMRLDFAVPSTFLRSLKPGASIVARTDDLPDMTFEGEVTSIDNAIDPVTRSIRVRATLPNDDLLLKAGMFMQVTLLADPRLAPSIPEQAIEPKGPDFFVYVVEKKGESLVANRRQVQLGMRQAGLVEVVSGLEAGDRVVTEGLLRVRNGGPVIIRDESILSPGIAKAEGASMGRGVPVGR